jgi:hypothetical protein
VTTNTGPSLTYFESELAWNDEITKAIPVGTTLASALEILKAEGFEYHAHSANTGEVYYRKSKAVGFLVVREWSVGITHDDSHILGVTSNTWLTGP